MNIPLPIPPVLTTPVLGELPTFDTILPEPLVLPTFTGILPLEPESTVMGTIPFVYQAYASILQSDLDSKIVDLTSYVIPNSSLIANWLLAKDQVLRKYDQARRQLLQDAGKKNYVQMPGHIMSAMKDLTMEERRTLSEEALKLTENGVIFSLDAIEKALKLGLDDNAIQFDSHHRLQSATFEAASTVIEAGLQGAALKIEAYNKSLSAVEQQIRQVVAENEAKIKELEAYISQLQIPELQIEIEILMLEVYSAAIQFEVDKAKLALLSYEVYIIQLEIEKLEAQTEVSRAELTLSLTNAVTAQYEVQKAKAEINLAELEKYKIAVEVAKSNLEENAVLVQKAKSELSSAIELADAEYEGQRNIVTLARENLAAAIDEARIAIARAETAVSGVIANTAIANALQKIYNDAFEREERRKAEVDVAQNSKEETEAALTDAESLYRTQMSLVAMERKALMIEAAVNAANALVRSDFYKVDGGQKAPP